MSTQQQTQASTKTSVKQDDVAGDPRRLSREIVLPRDADGFFKMPDDGLRYSPEECNAVALRGYLVNAVERVSPDNGAFTALVFHTTAPTKALDIEGNVVDVPVNSKVEIVATVKLQQHIRYATHPKMVFEFKIQPTKAKKIGAGRSMWLYDISMHPEPIKRPTFYPVIAPAALPAVGVQSGQNDLPF